jgi:PAS domain S-box-containing protein
MKKKTVHGRNDMEKLREGEQLFQTLTERSLVGIYVVQDGLFKSANPNAASYAGYTPEDLVGKESNSIVHPEDREIQKEGAINMLKGKRSSPYEFRIIGKNGETHWIMETVTPILFMGRPAILGNSMDITEHKRKEEALRESERRLADIIDFLPDATLAIDRRGKVIAWNRAMEEMTGVKAPDMLGKGDYEYALPFYGMRRPILLDLVLKPDKEIEQSYYSILKKEKDLLIVEKWIPFLHRRRAFIYAKASPLYDGRGNIMGAIESIRDITERKHAEEALEKREKELETKTLELEDLNAALRVLLKQREEDRSELEQKVLSNIKVLVLPHMEKLKNHVDLKGMSYVHVLESNLIDIVSPFAQKLSVKYMNLTKREVQIANLIKEGKTTKEIASFLNVSESAVNVFRYHIRHKLGLTKKHNLGSYLSSLA